MQLPITMHMAQGTTFLGLDYSQQDFYVDNEGRKAK